jgi:hypothetical protein
VLWFVSQGVVRSGDLVVVLMIFVCGARARLR